MNLKARAQLYNIIRNFFADRSILEVTTPYLAPSVVPDASIKNISLIENSNTLYLQPSPELFMKQLLANGSGAIYQLGKAFRAEELGKHHNSEFMMLEWYRPNFNYQQLMDEVADLVTCVLGITKIEKITYAAAFKKYTGIHNIHTVQLSELKKVVANSLAHEVVGVDDDIDQWLSLLLTELIEPNLDKNSLTFIYDYPASQASLSKVHQVDSQYQIAQRFELYVGGVELANGFQELTDSKEQRVRFNHENKKRINSSQAPLPIDEEFLQAIDKMPECSGVALGVDRLLMLKLGLDSIQELY